MSKHNTSYTLVVLAGVYLFFFLFNYLMPMIFGDDYVYSFIWQGKPMYVPLTGDAMRVSSWGDLIASQWSSYFTWSGRTVNHTLSQIFLWTGKDIFNFLNAAVSTLLIVEIYWCTHKGVISFDFKRSFLFWVLFSLWVFTPRFSPVFFWLVGACNYLWTTVLLLGFLLPYIRKYYFFHVKFTKSKWFTYGMFVLGMISGLTNENSICWVIVSLTLFLFITYKNDKIGIETWMITGLSGLILGYAMLILAPGNLVRLDNRVWFSIDGFLHRFKNLTEVLVWQFFLWHYCICSLQNIDYACVKVKVPNLNNERLINLKKDLILVKFFCALAFGMSAIMLFSPEFPLRSAFPGTVQLIIATGIIMRAQNELGIELHSKRVNVFLVSVGMVYFIISSGIMIHHLHEHLIETRNLLTAVRQWQLECRDNQSIFSYKKSLFRKRSRTEDFLSGCKTFDNILSEDENSWENVAFARYYGIKGIRMINESSTLKND